VSSWVAAAGDPQSANERESVTRDEAASPATSFVASRPDSGVDVSAGEDLVADDDSESVGWAEAVPGVVATTSATVSVAARPIGQAQPTVIPLW